MKWKKKKKRGLRIRRKVIDEGAYPKFSPNDCDVNFIDKTFLNWSVLHFAAVNKNTNALKEILSSNQLKLETINSQDTKGATALMSSAWGYQEGVQLLLEAGADESIKDLSAEDYSRSAGLFKIRKMIQNAGPSKERRRKWLSRTRQKLLLIFNECRILIPDLANIVIDYSLR